MKTEGSFRFSFTKSSLHFPWEKFQEHLGYLYKVSEINFWNRTSIFLQYVYSITLPVFYKVRPRTLLKDLDNGYWLLYPIEQLGCFLNYYYSFL